jgi:hypothetical protein
MGIALKASIVPSGDHAGGAPTASTPSRIASTRAGSAGSPVATGIAEADGERDASAWGPTELPAAGQRPSGPGPAPRGSAGPLTAARVTTDTLSAPRAFSASSTIRRLWRSMARPRGTRSDGMPTMRRATWSLTAQSAAVGGQTSDTAVW